MAERRQKLCSTTKVFVLLFCLWQVLFSVRGVSFRKFGISENWTRAKKSCKNISMILAEIDNMQSLRSRKESLYKYLPSNEKYWTGLKYTSTNQNKLVWSDGREAICNATLSDVVNCTGLKNFKDSACFLITASKDRLEAGDCTIAHRFVCQTVRQPTTTKKPTSDIQHVTRATVDKHSSGGGLIEKYLKTIRSLNESDLSSLQRAMNATDRLLDDLNSSDENLNVLLSTKALEAFVKSYAKHHLTISKDNIVERRNEYVIIMRKIPSKAGDVSVTERIGGSDGVIPLNDSDVHMRLPSSLFRQKGGYVAVIVYKDIDRLLPSQAQDSLDGVNTQSGQIGSRIITITVDREEDPFHGKVSLDFRHLKTISPMLEPDCVFWNFTLTSSHNGSWSKKDCRVINNTSNRTYCSCDHLTHFAVLMQIKDNKISDKHQVALQIITYVGCALSLAGESITVVAFVVFLNIKAEDTQIRLNLVSSIALAQLIFIAGIDATQSKALCTTVAAAQHYFFLVSFCWMLMEGLVLYYKVVKVFDIEFKMRPLYIFSWGFPMLVVLTSLVTAACNSSITSYTSDSFCWLSFSNGLVWFFVAPVLLISLQNRPVDLTVGPVDGLITVPRFYKINVLILARVTRELFTMHPTNISESNKFKRILRACLVLFPLLGLTWVFGLLSITEPIALVFQYLFTVCNSLQGFLIFLLHVVRSSEFRAAVERKIQLWGRKRNAPITPASALPTNNKTTHDASKQSSAVLSGQEEAL